jgi:hypothetical protein
MASRGAATSEGLRVSRPDGEQLPHCRVMNFKRNGGSWRTQRNGSATTLRRASKSSRARTQYQVADIMSDQTRALRVRCFFDWIQSRPNTGAYLSITMPSTGHSPCGSAEHASRFPTTLRRLTVGEFDQLAGHGYGVAGRVRHQTGLCF